MTLTKRPVEARIYDNSGVGPVLVEVTYEIMSDNPEAVALGAAVRRVPILCEAPRSAVAAFVATLQIVNPTDWPISAIPLPLPVKP